MDSKLWRKLNAQNWDELMDKLYAHSISRINWFGLKSEIKTQGKQSKDFAHEAVTLLWEGKRKWDDVKEPDLVQYLKSVINSLIYNMVKSKERDVFTGWDLTEGIKDSVFVDLMLEKRLIGDDFVKKLEKSFDADKEISLVFKSLAAGFKPAEIEEKHGISISSVRNAQKRLRRHIKNVTDYAERP